VKNAFHTALETAGIKDFTWHDLRHTFASWLIMKGASLRAVGGGRGLAASLAGFHERQTYRPVGPWQIAWYYAMAGDTDRAFELLDRANRERRSSLTWSLADPGWDGMRSDPRFRICSEA